MSANTGDRSGLEHLDLLIVGAGLSGIDWAYRVQTQCPTKSYAIVESRDAIGGTWDLFRYPGIRSDSDMATLGFPFRPWCGDDAIVEGARIRDYIAQTAQAFGIDRRIRFGERVVRADWSSADARWQVELDTRHGPRTLTCGFLCMASGYYDYAGGYRPHFAGEAGFAGTIVHPQSWPGDLDASGKRVVVIGSGATAITLVPSLARSAAHVTMLQRSPTYVVAMPTRDRLAIALRGALPARLADALVRWKNVLVGSITYRLARSRPRLVRRRILADVARRLGPGQDIAAFTPSYDPWDQRICLAPDGDLFTALNEGRATIVTGRVARFASDGIVLEDGRLLAADIVVTATGLVVKLLGGAALSVDGVRVDPAERLVYRGTMLADVPNLALAFGYTNASWTLKCDLSARWLCRVLNHMNATGRAICVAEGAGAAVSPEPMLDFTSGYVQRAAGLLPRQGNRTPWRLHQNYLRDLLQLRFSRLEDGVLRFRHPAKLHVDGDAGGNGA